jgi:uncharacterized protein YuzE
MIVYPRFCDSDHSFSAEFAPGTQRPGGDSVRMVIDVGSEAEVLGVEILDVKAQLGASSLKVIEQLPQRDGRDCYAYDEDSDSLYLRVRSGRSVDQVAVDGIVVCDDDGRLVEVRAEWNR